MLLYGWISPQARLAELSVQAAQARATLHRFDGDDVRVVWALAGRAVNLSLRQIAVILGPAVCAAAPIFAIAWTIDAIVDLDAVQLTSRPSWLSSGHAVFWLPLSAGALAVKWARGIK